MQLYLRKVLLLIDTQKDLVRCLLEAEQNNCHCPFEKQAKTIKLKWTKHLVDWVELVYALHETKCFNDGKITLIDLFQSLGEIFNIKTDRFSQIFGEIKNRSKGDGTVFIEKMKKALLQKIEDSEMKYQNRTRR